MILGRIARQSGARGLSGVSSCRATTGVVSVLPMMATTTSIPNQQQLTVPSRRFLADSSTSNSGIEVEHAREAWKTYGNLASYKPGNYHILTFNKISPVGLKQFPSENYDIFKGEEQESVSKSNAHAILLRSHKLQEEQVPHTVRAIAR